MLDVGRKGVSPPSPELSFSALKRGAADPAGYFLGNSFEGVLLPDSSEEYYGIPPSKDYIFDLTGGFRHASDGFAPLFSFARGGLAEAWTAGCYPLNDEELRKFALSYSELESSYEEVARRIGVTGCEDDLARYMPVHGELLPPLRLDRHSQKLLERYEGKRGRINLKTGAYLGRTRVATLSRAHGSRHACNYLGRCLWGCPLGSLYTPSHTLQECLSYSSFKYISGVRVDYFKLDSSRRVRSVVVRSVDSRTESEFPVDRLALAAGTLVSSRIVMHSVLREFGERIRLRGLMDNRQILVPFVNLRMIGEPFSDETYQYHLLGMGIEANGTFDYIHGQITTLKTALLHPIIQKLPFDLRTSTFVTRSMHAALGVVNVNFCDTRRNDNYLELGDELDDGQPRLRIRYVPSADEPTRMREGMRRVTQTLRMLGCIVPPGMAHVRPMGASVHYAGTLPMSREATAWTTTQYGQSRDFDNLFIVDGSTFPHLPAKNITFTLMANAVRIAENAF